MAPGQAENAHRDRRVLCHHTSLNIVSIPRVWIWLHSTFQRHRDPEGSFALKLEPIREFREARWDGERCREAKHWDDGRDFRDTSI